MPTVNRRDLLGASVIGLGAGLAGMGAGALIERETSAPPAAGPDTAGLNGSRLEPFHGRHQAGVETSPQTHGLFLSLSLRPETDRSGVTRLLRLLTEDAARLTQGRAPLADPEPELAEDPARLTITFGFGRDLVARAGRRHVPDWLAPLPQFGIDRLRPELCRGDLLLQVCSDDPTTVAHAARMLLKDAEAFTRPAWQKAGFRRAYGSDPAGTTARNLFGQVDGTSNPAAGSADFARLVWGETGSGQQFGPRGAPPTDLATDYPDWLVGGTSLVLRDIAMNLDTWDEVDRPGREFSVGRSLSTGAPLTGEHEFDIPDLSATTEAGLKVISPVSHVARSRNVDEPAEQIHRRVYNYHSIPITGEVSEGGMMFASYQASIHRQFLPIQRRLDEADLLNAWTSPIGSTVWAIPPGCDAGDYIGSRLLEA